MRSATAYAKINLALVVGPVRVDGRHELVTLLQAVGLSDGIELEQSDALAVEGFEEDTIVSAALTALARAAGTEPAWHVRIDKRIPVAAGLGGGSSDAAAALRLANAELSEPLADDALRRLAAGIGADVPFFLAAGPQLATGDGTVLRPLDLPEQYSVLLVVPDGARKESTASVYRAFDDRAGADGFDERRTGLLRAADRLERARDLAALPRNDLAASPLSAELVRSGAFRADVSGAGPTVYGLYERAEDAARAAGALSTVGRTFLTRPVRDDLPPLAR